MNPVHTIVPHVEFIIIVIIIIIIKFPTSQFQLGNIHLSWDM